MHHETLSVSGEILQRSGWPSKVDVRMKRKHFREAIKRPTATLKNYRMFWKVMASPCMWSTVFWTVIGCRLGWQDRSLFLQKKNMQDSDHVRKHVFIQTKVQLFGLRRSVRCKAKAQIIHWTPHPTVKHGGGSIMLWGQTEPRTKKNYQKLQELP